MCITLSCIERGEKKNLKQIGEEYQSGSTKGWSPCIQKQSPVRALLKWASCSRGTPCQCPLTPPQRISVKVPGSASWNYVCYLNIGGPIRSGLQADQQCVLHRLGFEQQIVMTLSYIKNKLDFSQWPWAEKRWPVISALNHEVALCDFEWFCLCRLVYLIF